MKSKLVERGEVMVRGAQVDRGDEEEETLDSDFGLRWGNERPLVPGGPATWLDFTWYASPQSAVPRQSSCSCTALSFCTALSCPVAEAIRQGKHIGTHTHTHARTGKHIQAGRWLPQESRLCYMEEEFVL